MCLGEFGVPNAAHVESIKAKLAERRIERICARSRDSRVLRLSAILYHRFGPLAKVASSQGS